MRVVDRILTRQPVTVTVATNESAQKLLAISVALGAVVEAVSLGAPAAETVGF